MPGAPVAPVGPCGPGETGCASGPAGPWRPCWPVRAGGARGSSGALGGEEHPEGGRLVGRLAVVGGDERGVARAVVRDDVADRVAGCGGVGSDEVESLPCRADGSLRALGADRALRASGASRALWTGEAGGALGAGGSGGGEERPGRWRLVGRVAVVVRDKRDEGGAVVEDGVGKGIVAGGVVRTLEGEAGGAGRALSTGGALRASGTLRAGEPLRAGLAGDSLGALGTGLAGRAGGADRALRAGGALRAGCAGGSGWALCGERAPGGGLARGVAVVVGQGRDVAGAGEEDDVTGSVVVGGVVGALVDEAGRACGADWAGGSGRARWASGSGGTGWAAGALRAGRTGGALDAGGSEGEGSPVPGSGRWRIAVVGVGERDVGGTAESDDRALRVVGGGAVGALVDEGAGAGGSGGAGWTLRTDGPCCAGGALRAGCASGTGWARGALAAGGAGAAGGEDDLELGGVGGLVVLFAVELEDGGGGCEGEAVVRGGRGDPGLDSGGDVDGDELAGGWSLRGADAGAGGGEGVVGDAVLAPRGVDAADRDGAGSGGEVAVEAEGGAGDLGGGGAGGEDAEVKLDEGGVAAADVEVGEGAGVDVRLGGGDVGVGDEGGLDGEGGRGSEQRRSARRRGASKLSGDAVPTNLWPSQRSKLSVSRRYRAGDRISKCGGCSFVL